MVVHENAVRHALARLPGRKIIYSNAPRHYVDEVVRTLGVARYFDAVYSIESTRYLGKPSVAGFRMLLRKHHLRRGALRAGGRHAGEFAHCKASRAGDSLGEPGEAERALRRSAHRFRDAAAGTRFPLLRTSRIGSCPGSKASASSKS